MSDLTLWLTVVVAVLISLFAIYFAVSPLLQAGHATPLIEDDKLTELLGRKDSVMQAIKDLEFDYRLGKMSEEDYQRLDQRLRRQAIGLLQQIEKVAPESATLEDQLEGIIAQFRKTTVAATAAAPTAKATVNAPVAAEKSPVVRFCTQCGKPTEPSHKFCAQCGTPIAQVDPAQQV